MNDLISVIITTHHEPIYILEKCLNSLNEQTYDNCEFIIVNDDSQVDGCKEFLDYYVKTHDRFSVTHCNKNQGFIKSKNLGSVLARGKWISFVDADMTLKYDFYEYAIKTADKHDDCWMVYGKIYHYQEGNNILEYQPIGTLTFGDDVLYWPMIGPAILLRQYVVDSGYYPNEDVSDNELFVNVCLLSLMRNTKQYWIEDPVDEAWNIHFQGFTDKVHCFENKSISICSNMSEESKKDYQNASQKACRHACDRLFKKYKL